MEGRKRLYLDMDGVLVDFASAVAELHPDVKKEYADHLDDVPGVFGAMRPMPGALDAFTALSEVFEVYLLSTAPWHNVSAWSDKAAWVQRWLGDAGEKRLILTHRKDLAIGDFLVDDRDDPGQVNFGGEHIHFGTERFPDWSVVLPYLLARA